MGTPARRRTVGDHAASRCCGIARASAVPGPRPPRGPPPRRGTALRSGPQITGRAVCLGAAICQGRHEEAVALAGHPAVAAMLEIQPPAASGFLRWRDGIGYNGLGAPVVACHWGPAPGGGRWLAWWADSHATAAGYAAQAKAAGQYISPGSLTRIFGPLWYDHQELLRPTGGSTRHDGNIAEPGPAAADAGPSSAQAGTPGLALLYTTLATWWLLTCPDAVP